MSSYYTACFRLNKNKTVDESKIQAFLKQYRLEYKGVFFSYALNEDGNLRDEEREDVSIVTLEQFMTQINDHNFSPKSRLIQSEIRYRCSLGFATVGTERFCILEDISSSMIFKLADFLRERNLSVLQLFSSLYQALPADTMVCGMDIYFEDLLAFMDGIVDEYDVEHYIRIAVGVNEKSLESLRAFGGKNVLIGNKQGVTQWGNGAFLGS
ncbi:MAG: hypothetical protein DRR16_33680 [Candidatus Parabeggiatoa sp. nov. 3]|nr:MAG: hypothetical protein DRR00_34335 [Gammaproteobacteria bacterium]RKZ72816.1 MAG: hypothetical protein DRR16_33680 [Gammaproteobacteria bacterium]